MIGTAMISGSLVTGDTLTELFTRGAYFGYGHADAVVYARHSTTFGFQGSAYQYFGYNVYHSLSAGLSNSPSAGADVVGVTPEIIETVSIYDSNKGIVQAGSALIGSFSNASRALGDFHSTSGSIIPSTFKDTEGVLNDKAARDLNATIGDTVTVYSAQRFTAQHLNFTVVGIAVSDERGSFTQGDDVFVTLNSAQQFTGHPNSANYIAITNIGGLRGAIQYSQIVALAANRTLDALYSTTQSTINSTSIGCKTDLSTVVTPPAIPCAFTEKKLSVDSATDGAKSLSQFFLILSSFAILAGIVLILNIFIMLAEERKSEMGMARAIGMRRGQLTRLFLFEGSLYSAGASIVGVLVGIGVAYAILYAIGNIFSAFIPSLNESLVLSSFTISPESLFAAFTAGVLITYVTILLTSWRISKLNIIRAIRNIPEPPRGKRTYTLLLVAGFAMALAGVVVFQASFAAKSTMEALVGPSLIIFGAGLILSRFLRNRYEFTLSGFALLVQWAVPSLSFDNPRVSNNSFGPEVFIVGGIIMVVASVLVVMYNTDVPLKLLRFLLRKRRTLTAIFKIALAYPENKRFRTAATVAMFALVIFTVSAIGSIAAEQNAALDKLVRQDSGGYDIITSTRVPVSNLTTQIMRDPHLNGLTVIPFNSTFLISIHDVTINQDFGKPPELIGADPNSSATSNFFLTNTFNMVNMTSNYKTAADVWNAVRTNSSKVVWSFGRVNTRGAPQSSVTPVAGDFLELKGFGVPAKTVQVVGILDGIFYEGLISRSQLLWDSFHVSTGTLSFVKVGPGQDPVTVSNILRRDFVKLQMATIVIPVLLANILQISQSILGLFEGFLGLGLVVGIAGLGILSVRSVVERRQEIGVLRALGFRRRMVIAAFIIENSYVALLGIMIGVLLGVNLGYAFAVSPNSGLTFVLPWQSILEIVGLAYGLSLLTTFNSSRRAGRIPPAEALRYSE